MATAQLKYKGGYKYQVHANWIYQTKIKPDHFIRTPYIQLDKLGLLYINKGYAWDGASGFPDIDSIIRGSLAHDALYQLIREGHLPPEFREMADQELIYLCDEDDMWEITQAGVWQAVRVLGAPAANPRNVKPILIAP